MPAIIYRITSPNGLKHYIGSTKKYYLSNRKADHISKWKLNKGRRCASHDLFDEYGVDKCEFVEIEKVPEEQRFERERYWMEFYHSINYIRPYSTKEEKKHMKKEWFQNYKIEHSEEYKERNHNSYLKQKEKLSHVNVCECGVSYTEGHKKRHMNSQRHARVDQLPSVSSTS